MKRKRFNIPFIAAGMFACLVLALYSCTSEEVPGGERGQTLLTIPVTRSGGEAENKMGTLRMIVFGPAGNLLVNTTTPKVDNTFEEIVPVGKVHVYLLANELPSWNLDAVTSLDDLKAKKIAFSAYPVVDDNNLIPMFGAYPDLYADLNGITREQNSSGNVVTGLGLVYRLYSKVSLTLQCTFADLTNGGEPIAVSSVQGSHLSRESYLYPDRYYGPAATDFFTGAVLVPSYSQSDNAGFEYRYSFYVPEYLVNDIDLYSYISVVTNLVSVPSITKEYKLVIGDGIPKGYRHMLGLGPGTRTLADMNITRNTHYTFKARIKGFDETGDADMDIEAKVVTWEGMDIPTTYPVYLLAVSKDNFNLAAGETGYVYVTTDHPDGWSATIGKGSALSTTQFTGYTSGSLQPSGYLGIQAGTITVPDTVKVTAGNMTKKILIEN